MKNRMHTNPPKAGQPSAPANEITELNDADLRAVSGGLNPQPLPPSHEGFRFM